MYRGKTKCDCVVVYAWATRVSFHDFSISLFIYRDECEPRTQIEFMKFFNTTTMSDPTDIVDELKQVRKFKKMVEYANFALQKHC